MYVVDCYKKAMFEWPNAQWKRRCGSPVLNAELWKKLRNNIKKVESRVNIKYVRGHSEDKDNRAVDVMAKLSANNPQKKNENRANVRRKYFGKKGQQGSVRMCGQRISIWINFSEYLSTQKVWRYKYEVISPKSKFYKRSGSIFYNKYLRLGHGYLVSFNKNDDDPRIVNDFKEIKKIIYKNYQPDSTNN